MNIIKAHGMALQGHGEWLYDRLKAREMTALFLVGYEH